jgi:hypothetical protein
MTNVPRQRERQSRASQSCAGSAPAKSSVIRRCRPTGAGLFHFCAAGLSLSRSGASAEKTCLPKRTKAGVYGQAPTQPDSARTDIRRDETIVHQRGSQPSIARAAATRTRAWVSRSQADPTLFGWNFVLIVCCLTNWRMSTSCWYRINAGPSDQSDSKRRTRLILLRR